MVLLGEAEIRSKKIPPVTSARRIRLFRNVHKLGESKVGQGGGHLWWEDFNDMETKVDIASFLSLPNDSTACSKL